MRVTRFLFVQPLDLTDPEERGLEPMLALWDWS